MGFLTKFTGGKSGLQRLPSGTFTVDPMGNVVSSTLPSWVPASQVRDIGQHILAVMKGAAAARIQISEMKIQYETFRITAREMRGGAIIFLSPKTVASLASH